MKFAFLILHYMNADVTADCIDSILDNIKSEDYHVVVVDNASNNGSGEALKEKYKEKDNIHFIANDKNLGYAKGNNVGFKFAKEELGADFIALANNDVIIDDPQWINKITALYEEAGFYILGPDIVTPMGTHQNPYLAATAGKKDILKKILHDDIVYILLKLGIQRKLKKGLHIQTKELDTAEYVEEKQDFHGVLHGSCIIFSKRYIDEFDGLYDGTFLYVEEEILCYILNKLGYRYSYSNRISVLHHHSVSMKKSIADEDKRKMVVISHRVKSYRKFFRIMCSGKNPGRYLKSSK